MEIRRPVKDSYTSQGFGENKANIIVDANGVPYRPFRVVGWVGKNTIPFYPAIGMKGHSGVDMATYHNSPCFFPVIAKTEWTGRHEMDFDGGIGLDVFSKSRIFIDKLPKEAGTQSRADWKANNKMMYVKFRFWHANKNVIQDNTEVVITNLIQLCGSTGASSGTHLHWSMKFVDGNRTTMDRDNGYYGAVDFSHWFIDEFILDYFLTQPKLTTEQTLYKMAWYIRNIDRKTAEILRAVAKIVSAFGVKVGGFIKEVKKQ